MTDPSQETNGSDHTADLQDLYQQTTAAASRDFCPDAATLNALANPEASELSPTERRRLVLHIADCSDCSVEVQALRRAPQLGQPEHPIPQQRPPADSPTPIGNWLLAASVLLAVGAAGYLAWLRPADTGESTRSAAREATASASIIPKPDSVLELPPAVLSWGIEGPFTVRLLTADGDVVAELSGSGTQIELASNVSTGDETLTHARTLLRQGGRFVWTVTTRKGSLGPYWFEVEARDSVPPANSDP